MNILKNTLFLQWIIINWKISSEGVNPVLGTRKIKKKLKTVFQLDDVHLIQLYENDAVRFCHYFLNYYIFH